MIKKNIYVNRQIEGILREVAQQFSSVAVTGPRQSGKSTMLKHLFGKSHTYVTFDDLFLREQALNDPHLFLENLGDYAIIDEIQYVPQILSLIKMKIDENRERKGYFIFTGSQQFAMIKNLGDSLAGRIALLDLLPFSIHEKQHVPGRKKMLNTTLKSFVDGCLRGSFPEVSVNEDMDSSIWYNSYITTYLERDVRTTYNIERVREFQSFMQLLAARCSQELNLTSLSNDLGVGINTIKRWISILEASRIIFLLPPYYKNYGKRIIKAPKVYFLDCGLVCHLVGIKNKEFLLNGPMAGALFENYYIQETVKYFFNTGRGQRLYYCKVRNVLEVDLIIENENMELSLYEIKCSKTPRTSMSSHLYKFLEVFPKLKIKNSSILSLSDSSIKITKDVYFTGIADYLSNLF